MMKALRFIFAACATLLFVSGGAAARESVPIVPHENILVTRADGRTLSKEQVRDGIVRGSAARRWEATPGGSDTLIATLVVRGKHTVIVEIPYAADRFSVRFKSSVNMNYAVRDGRPIIHPNYNRWVLALIDAIRVEILRS